MTEKIKNTHTHKNIIPKNWISIKCVTTYNGTQEKKRGRHRRIFGTIMTESFAKLMADTKPKIQEAQISPNMINALSHCQLQNKTKQKLYPNILYSNAIK